MRVYRSSGGRKTSGPEDAPKNGEDAKSRDSTLPPPSRRYIITNIFIITRAVDSRVTER